MYIRNLLFYYLFFFPAPLIIFLYIQPLPPLNHNYNSWIQQIHTYFDYINMKRKVLITGGSGFIGSALTQKLLSSGYDVNHLSRSPKKNPVVPTYQWDINNAIIDHKALKNVDTVIHLAGAGIADKRWTNKRKEELIISRVKSSLLLLNALKSSDQKINTFISASAVGYYGADTNYVCKEDSPPGRDFPAILTTQWEDAARKFEDLNIRTIILRIGLVLSSQDGLLKKLEGSVNMGLGSSMGSGEQYMSWIHIDDLTELFLTSIQNPSMKGVYNAVSPDPVKNNSFMHTINRIKGMPKLIPKIPALLLKLMFGEMATMMLGSCKASSQKVILTGFKFQHPKLEGALKHLLK